MGLRRPLGAAPLLLASCGLAAAPPAPVPAGCSGSPPAYAELDVQVERTQQIFNESEAIHGAHGLGTAAAGDLIVTVGVNFQNSLVKRWVPRCGPRFACVQSRSKRSRDQGRHWEMLPVNATTNRSVSEFSNYAFALPGTTPRELIQFTGFQLGSVATAGSGLSSVRMEMIRSVDNAQTQQTSAAIVLAPAGLLREGWISTSHTSIVALQNPGEPLTLLANIYAPWDGVDGYNEPAKRSKTRVAVIRSADAGRSWRYLSTVAWDPINATVAEDRSEDCAVNGMCNGFDEATLVVAGDRVGFGSAAQTIICVMRSGGPLYRSISISGGASWSTPTAIAPHGVSPQFALVSSGILALVYGRPDNYLRFSVDGGRTFLDPEFCFHKVEVQPYDGGSYDSAIAIPGTDTLLLTYAVSRTPFDMSIEGMYLTVRRKNASEAT